MMRLLQLSKVVVSCLAQGQHQIGLAKATTCDTNLRVLERTVESVMKTVSMVVAHSKRRNLTGLS